MSSDQSDRSDRSALDTVFGEQVDAPVTGRDRQLFAALTRLGRECGFVARAAAQPAESDVASVEAIARASAARCRRVALPDGWWRQDHGALLAWQGEARTPVALLPSLWGGYRIHEPASGRTRRLTPALARALAADAVCFYGTLPDTRLTLWQVLRFGAGSGWRDWLTLALAGAGSAWLAMAIPYAISVLFSGVVPSGDRGQLMQIGVALAGCALAAFVLDCVCGLAHVRMSGRSGALLTAALWDRLLRLPPALVQRTGSGDVGIRLSTGASLQDTVLRMGFDIATRGQHLLVSLAVLFIAAPLIGLLALLAAGIMALATWLMAWMQTQAVMHGAPVQGNVYNQPVEYLATVAKLRTAGAEQRAFERWAANFAALRRRSFKAGRVGSGFHAFCAAYEVLALTGLFYQIARPGGLLATGGLGLCLVLISAFGTFIAALLPLAQGLGGLGMVLARARRLALLMDNVPAAAHGGGDPGTLSGRVALDNVSVRYARQDPWALQRVSLRAEPGEFIAIVGPSGGGKSTLVRVLLGLLRPEQGSVLYDGRDLAALHLDAVRRQIGTVMQRGHLVPGSLLENIAGPHEVTPEQVLEAARLAAVDTDIEVMPMGLHTMVLDGTAAFAGGQVQRLLVARALVSKPPIVIFDEATSALDARTQALVVERVGALRCTRIVIAHRFSTIRKADRVYVMQGGHIAEQGGVEELLAKGGYLAQMAAREGLGSRQSAVPSPASGVAPARQRVGVAI